MRDWVIEDADKVVNTLNRCDDLLVYFGLPPADELPAEPIHGGTAGGLATVLTATRALIAARMWVKELTAEEREQVRRRLARRQEWYALALWSKLCE